MTERGAASQNAGELPLRFEGVSHRFADGHLGLNGIDLEVREGDFLVIAGRNGCGKSLLARHAIGLDFPTAGTVYCRGKSVRRDPAAARRSLGLVFQDADAQIIGQTVLEDVAFGPSNLGLSKGEILERSTGALAAVGLSGRESRRPDTLSGGERRRLAVAGALAFGPDCLILDEPFANLDLESIRGLLEVVVALHSSGKTVVLITHELEKTLAHATRLAVMDGGTIAWEGKPDGLAPARFADFGLMNPFRYGHEVGELTWLA